MKTQPHTDGSPFSGEVKSLHGPALASVLAEAHRLAAGGDIVPLDQLSAPIVGRLQACLRAQERALAECLAAMSHALETCGGKGQLYATETESRLVTAMAMALREPRSETANRYRAHHDDRHDYGCVDDGWGKDAGEEVAA
jgi:hypothetical protein